MTPNLMLIWTDQQRADTLACYGNEHVFAPHLNRLASESFVFEHAYCVQPVCTPSRGTILTGLWPHRHGAMTNNVPLPRDVRTLAELVDPDYRRAHFGKWHLGDEVVAQHGFDEWVSMEDQLYREFYSRPEYFERFSDYHHYLIANGYQPYARAKDGAAVFSREMTAALPPQHTRPHFLGRSVARFIREHDRQRPFLINVNFLEPHTPFFGPYNDRYDPALVPAGPAFGRPPAADASVRNRALAAWYQRTGWPGPVKTEQDWRRVRANYYGLVTLVDEAVGMMLKALDEAGLADNTLVCFTSDHGEMMGDHALLTKGVLYEEAIRVPCLMRVPWLGRSQQMLRGRVSQIDLVPTLLELVGQPVGAHLQGVSRAPVLRGEATLANNDVFALWRGADYNLPQDLTGFTPAELASVARAQWRTVVSADGWKLNLCNGDRCELYDLHSDPYELTNRFDDPAQRQRVHDLAGRIHRWQRQIGDDLALQVLTS